jgi:hypothetical protein
MKNTSDRNQLSLFKKDKLDTVERVLVMANIAMLKAHEEKTGAAREWRKYQKNFDMDKTTRQLYEESNCFTKKEILETFGPDPRVRK